MCIGIGIDKQKGREVDRKMNTYLDRHNDRKIDVWWER